MKRRAVITLIDAAALRPFVFLAGNAGVADGMYNGMHRSSCRRRPSCQNVKNKEAANLKAAPGRVYSPKVLGRSNE